MANAQIPLPLDRVTFSREVAENQKTSGMALVAKSREEVLDVARRFAVAIAWRQHTVTMDDVQLAMLERGYRPSDLGNAAGSLFRGKQWVFTGQWAKSTRVSNHARMNRVWRLRDGRN